MVDVMTEAQTYRTPPWEYIGVPEAAGLDVWMIWGPQSREVEAHRRELVKMKARRK